MTSMLCTLYLKLTLQILCESCRFMGVWMVQGYKGVGDIPGIQGVQGGSSVKKEARKSQKKTAFSHEKSRKSHKKQTFP